MKPNASAPTMFTSQADFRSWLKQYHTIEKELLVGCYKVHVKHKGITYAQALDEALCFGWIDGIRRRYNEEMFTVRFTPRKHKSIWSAVNIKRVTELEAEGRMHSAGMAAFRAREEKNSRVYSYESKTHELDSLYLEELQANKKAWMFFQMQPPWYQRTSKFWIMSAKREVTRQNRLRVLIECSKRKTTIPMLTRPSTQTE